MATNGNKQLRVAPDDETYWLAIRAEMAPAYVNTQLVNSRRGPAPKVVRDKIKSLVDLSLSYELDEYDPFKEMKESGSTLSIRSDLAEYFGATVDEIALTRNAMEGISTVLNGLGLSPGDEILATKYCYDFNLAIIRQRAARDGLVLRLVDLPFGPVEDRRIVEAFENAISSKTRLISIPHISGRTGLVFPIKAIADLARRHGAFTLVDGAHSAGHLDFRIDDLGCDAFAACLHKWMHGPRGTGFLFIRREMIRKVWPLFATWSGKPADSIEKFEEVGTVFKALPAAIPEMISFNKRIGQAEKSARFQYLRHRWASRLLEHKRFQLLTDIAAEPGSSFGAFVVQDIDCDTFARMLLEGFDIHVKAFAMEEDSSMTAIHLSPGLCNTVEEIDGFVDAALLIVERTSKNGREASRKAT